MAPCHTSPCFQAIIVKHVKFMLLMLVFAARRSAAQTLHHLTTDVDIQSAHKNELQSLPWTVDHTRNHEIFPQTKGLTTASGIRTHFKSGQGVSGRSVKSSGSDYESTGEGHILLGIKRSLDPVGVINLTNWNASDGHFCGWTGVTCDPTSEHVVELNLTGMQLQGFIDPLFGNLTLLAKLTLSNNNISGRIPPELSNCKDLFYLHLDHNLLTGTIPPELGQLKNLGDLYVQYNQLSGSIPAELGSCISLVSLSLESNNLSGHIPTSLGGCRNLIWIFLSHNNLSGSIPAELGSLQYLQGLFMFNNMLTGSIPASLGNCTSLVWLSFERNNLSGHTPTSLGGCRNLTGIFLSHNNLSGSIPAELGSLQYLEELSMSNNMLTGSIPASLGNYCKNLIILDLSLNYLSGSIPASLGTCKNLLILYLYNNNLTSSIPRSLSNCEKLQYLNLDHNFLTGGIPEELGLLDQLQVFVVKGNSIEGRVLASLLNLSALVVVDFSHNRLEGALPAENSSVDQEFLPNLRVLSFASNFGLDGAIPAWIANLKSLQLLDLSKNRFSGKLPSNLHNLHGFKVLYYSNGTLDSPGIEINIKGKDQSFLYFWRTTTSFDLSSNALDGDIPLELGTLVGLLSLNLAGNMFTGQIPSTIVDITVLESFDISYNKLSGEIPVDLGTNLASLGFFNVSYNNLSGMIPTAGNLNTRFSNSSFAGNVGLCGRPLTKQCISLGGNSTYTSKHSKTTTLADIVSVPGFPVAFFVGFMSAVFVIMFWKPAWVSRL